MDGGESGWWTGSRSRGRVRKCDRGRIGGEVGVGGVEIKAAVRLLLLVLFPHLIVLYRGSAKRSSSRVRPVMYNT